MVKQSLTLGLFTSFLCLLTLSSPAWSQTVTNNYSTDNISATENNKVFLLTTVNKNQVYVQEALTYSIKLYYTLAFERGASFSRLEMPEAAYNKLGEDLNYTETINDILYTVYESRFIIFPQNSGEFNIAPVHFRAYTQTQATRNNPNLQTIAQRQTIELLSKAHQITVLPVPGNYPGPNWLPSNNVTISEIWSRSLEDMRIGDSVVRTIQLDAANLYASMLVNLEFTSGSKMRYYPAAAQQVDITENEGVRSEHTQNITLVATEAGRLTLPVVEIPWWNTATDSLEYATLPAQFIDILSVDGRRLESEPTLSGREELPSNYWSSINLNLLLLVGVLILISAIFFAPALVLLWQKLQISMRKLMLERKNDKLTPALKMPNINSRFNNLKQACEQHNIKATGEYFLYWGQAYFQNATLYSIDKLDVEFRQKSLSPLIKKLQFCLYAEEDVENKKTFDFGIFLQAVTTLHKNRKLKREKTLSYNLPPLYRN